MTSVAPFVPRVQPFLSHGSGTPVMQRPSKYTILGFLYFLRHPNMWRVVICPLIVGLIVGIVALALLFALALRPQVLALIDHGLAVWASWLVGVIFVILEFVFVMFIVMNICFGYAQDKLFEGTLRLEGVNIPEGMTLRRQLCVQLMCVIFRGILFIITLPLNAIPVLGTILFALLNGWLLAWDHHQGYFESKGWSFSEQSDHVYKNFGDFVWFGCACQLMELIPYVGLVAIFSNSVATALWIVDRERLIESASQSESGSPTISYTPSRSAA